MLNRHDKKRLKELEQKTTPDQKIIIFYFEDGVYRTSGEEKVEEAEVERLSKDKNNFILIIKKASEREEDGENEQD